MEHSDSFSVKDFDLQEVACSTDLEKSQNGKKKTKPEFIFEKREKYECAESGDEGRSKTSFPGQL